MRSLVAQHHPIQDCDDQRRQHWPTTTAPGCAATCEPRNHQTSGAEWNASLLRMHRLDELDQLPDLVPDLDLDPRLISMPLQQHDLAEKPLAAFSWALSHWLTPPSLTQG